MCAPGSGWRRKNVGKLAKNVTHGQDRAALHRPKVCVTFLLRARSGPAGCAADVIAATARDGRSVVPRSLHDLPYPALERALVATASTPCIPGRCGGRCTGRAWRDCRHARIFLRRCVAGCRKTGRAFFRNTGSGERYGEQRWAHAEVFAETGGRADHRDGVDGLYRTAHGVCKHAGGLRNGMCVLRDGADGVCAASAAGRNRGASAPCPAGGAGWRQAAQSGDDGHGRAAAQLRRGDDGAGDRDGHAGGSISGHRGSR